MAGEKSPIIGVSGRRDIFERGFHRIQTNAIFSAFNTDQAAPRFTLFNKNS